MSDILRFGVVGTGAVGLEHLNSLQHTRRAATVAVAEANPDRAHLAADRYKIPRSYSDYRELIDQPDIDAITIALPNHLHTPVAIEALKNRKHVLIEKPFAMSAKEAAKIIETARRMRRTLMVGMNYRFDRHTQTAKAIIQRGELGEVYHARCFWLLRSNIPRIGSWFTQKKLSGGGCFNDLGSHLLDTCLHLMGEFNVVSVVAHTKAKFGKRGLGEGTWGRGDIDPKRPFDVEDFGAALLRLKSGRTISLETAWAGAMTEDSRPRGIDLYGTEAGMKLFPARLFRRGPGGYETIELSAPDQMIPEDRIHHFVNCVLDGKKPLVTLEESLKLQKILDALYDSAKTGKQVRLK